MTYTNLKKVGQFIAGSGLAIAALAVVVLPTLASADVLYRQLQMGMRGNDVSSLQTFLAQDPTLYPQGLVTGYFGFLTKSGVANFQSRNGIPAVGRVGPQTLPVINAQMAGGGNTVGGDRRSPVISTVNLNVAASSATISWNTDEGAAGLVYYSTSPISLIEGSEVSAIAVSGNSAVSNVNLQTGHQVTLTGLQSNTDYYYVVYVRDGLGNESVTWPATLHTSN